jgi:modulator of FtsH protease
MTNQSYTLTSQSDAIAVNRVLRNTYILLSLTLLFSALVAGFAMVTQAPYPGILLTLVGVYGLMFLTYKLRNSVWGLASTFAFTGFMGYTLGPILNMVTASYANGTEIIMMAFGGTGIIFLGLSAYVLTTRKDFSFMTGFMVVGTLVALVVMVLGFFFHAPGFQLAISGLFMLLSSGWILWQTSAIIHGGERNYILATIGLYVQIYNLFISLIQIISAFSGRE